MQGWRTVALRIRGAKSELEDAGLETDGMVESTAKLHDLIKGISGVDIMLDENTFKSTYQIIEELGKVWNNIKDVDQASLLEAIAGKRQSNIVAAALTNYDRLDDVLQTSINSMGSARAEQEEYAKSIQYSIDTLKATYQDFADSVINSDFVKNLLGTAQSFLEVLTKIIDKFGTLPTILTGIAAIGGFKNIGLFGNLETGLTSVTTKFETLKQVLSYDFGGLYKKFNINLSSISDGEVQSLQNYVNALNGGIKPAEAMKDIMAETSEAAQQQATQFTYLYQSYQRGEISANQYKNATQNLALTQKTATATSKALSVALNTLANVGIMIAINLAIKGISSLVDKLVVTREELIEVRDAAIESSNQLKASTEELVEENNAINELVKKYTEISLSISNTTESKDELLQIQTDLIDKFGDEAESLDLVNGKYDEQIAKIKDLSDARYNEWKRQNAAAISRAEKVAGYNVGWAEKDEQGRYNTDAENYDYDQVFLKGWVEHSDELAASLYVVKGVSEDIENVWEKIDGVNFVDGIISNKILLSGTLEEARDQLGLLIDEYSRYEGRSDKTLNALIEHYKALNTELENTEYYMSEIRKREAPALEVIGEIDTTNIDKLQALIEATGDAREAWFNNLEETENSFGKSLDSMIKAIQTLADGDVLSSSDFWGIMELDTDKIISDIQMVGDGFVVSQEQLIALKDQYINQQIDSLKLENDNLETKKQTLSTTIDEAKAELSLLGARGMANAAYREEYQNALNTVKQAEANLEDYGDQIRRNNVLIEQWKSKIGDVVDRQKQLTDELKKVQDYADNLLKAQEYRIDQIIDGHQRELDALNTEKEALQDELDALNDQKDAIEEIIDKYDTVNGYIQKIVKEEIDAVKEQQQAIEDSYNKRIDALKAENEEREDALEYAEKLANLENAKRNKRYVLDETRGWRYESVKEDVVKAQNDLANFETSREINALEKERDKEVAVYDDIIDRKEKYLKQWEDIPDAIKDEQDELLAQELFGADVRERITNEDISLLETFDASYRKHNTDLKIITGTEIKLKQAAIDAKDAEIKSKDEQINKWKAYKTEVQNAAKDIKDATEDYIGLLNTVTVDENSSLETRTTNLNNFKDAYSNALQTAIDLQSQLDSNGGSYEYDVHVNGLDELKQAAAAGAVIAATAGMASTGVAALGVGGAMAIANSPIAQTTNDIVDVISEIMNKLNGYSQGGVADYTGMAMLHGRKNAPETIFNANDSAKLYDMVHNTPNLMADMLDKAVKISGFNLANTGNTNNTSTNLSFHIDKIVTDNPEDFAKQLDRYYQTKLTQSYTSRQ